MKRKLAKYFRLSQEDVEMRSNSLKDESNSIHSQRLLCDSFIDKHADLQQMQSEEFIDDGFSGTNFDRPAFQRMMNLVKSGEIQCIIVKDLSRFGRDYLQVGDYMEHIFPFIGVRFISINDHYDSNQYLGTTGGLDIAFRNLIYQKYSQDLSDKVKSAMHLKMSTGSYVTHCPYGYKKMPGIKHKMFIDPVTAPIVREIFLAIINGKKSTEIAADLNSRKIPTPQQHKKYSRKNQTNNIMWSHQAVLRIVRDYKYTGAMVNFKCENQEIRAKAQVKIPKEKWVIVENQHEPIISHEEFEMANEKIPKRKQPSVIRKDQRDRIYYCGHCGRKLRKTFGYDEYFSCPTKMYIKDCQCSDIFLAKSDLEKILMETYRRQLLVLQDRVEHSSPKKPEDILQEYIKSARMLSQAIELCDEEKIKQYEAYREGKVDKKIFLEHKSAILQRKGDLMTQLEEIERKIEITRQNQVERDDIHERSITAIQALNLSDDELRDETLEAIDRVIIYSNDELEIRWKQEDIFKQIHVDYAINQ